MNRVSMLCLVAIALLPASLAAQDQPVTPSPELVLPQVTVDIRDLSVENVQAMLPPAGPPPVIVKTDLILPPAPELAVQAPARTLAVGGTDPLGGAATPPRALATQATLGVGSQNRVVGDLNVTATSQNTQASLSFSHDSADGISGQAQGSGFDTRDDVIGGSLSGQARRVRRRAPGKLHGERDRSAEAERGLLLPAGQEPRWNGDASRAAA